MIGRWIHQFIIASCRLKQPSIELRRTLTSRRAAVLLRPFYFAVHPDRFADNKLAKQQNEKSLKVFNGYLNELLPGSRYQKPVDLPFFIQNKDGQVKEVVLSLSGSNVMSIIKAALSACGLPTSSEFEGPLARTSGGNVLSEIEQYESMMMKCNKEAMQYEKRSNLLTALQTQRSCALKAHENFRVMSRTLEAEIENIKKKTGVIQVIWLMHWELSHMRRSLIAVERLVDYPASPNAAKAINSALHGYILRFGRGSFVCCDGGIQFAADGVREQWTRVCSEALVRRAVLTTLTRVRARLSEHLGNANVIVLPHECLARTIVQIEAFITRIESRPAEEKNDLRYLARNTCVQIMSPYDELSVARDGYLLIPCNENIKHCITFLRENAEKSRDLVFSAEQLREKIRISRLHCISELRLADISWQQGMNREYLLSSIQRLAKCSDAVRNLLSGIHIHFCLNPTIYVMSDGRLSVPLDWVA